MKTILLNVLLLLLARQVSLAQETFKIQNASKNYNLMVKVAACGGKEQFNMPNMCGGAGRVSIYRKDAVSSFQVLNLKNIEVDKEQIAFNPEIDKRLRKLYDDEYSFIFGDFNFDGKEDLAICNGRNGGYGAPSYNVYLFNSRLNRFVENKKLSELTDGYLGLFFVDPKKKQLLAFSKSGCCYHETELYKVVSNKPVLVETIIEDASGSDNTGYDVLVTTRKLIKGRWVKRVRKEKVKGENP